MADHGHEELSSAGYIRIGALTGDPSMHVGEALGLKIALLPDAAAPGMNATLPKMGA